MSVNIRVVDDSPMWPTCFGGGYVRRQQTSPLDRMKAHPTALRARDFLDHFGGVSGERRGAAKILGSQKASH
jgi:hypothetical protein